MEWHPDADLRPPPAWLWFLALPLVGLALLLARPGLDIEWRHQPSHFWLVLIVALLNVALATLTNEAAMHRRDARLVLISLAFGVSAGFLALHALATPGVLLPGANLGFVIATPVGLTIASIFSAAAVLPLAGPRGEIVLRHAGALRTGVGIVLVGWGLASMLRIPPLVSEIPAAEVAPPLRLLALAAVALYGFAAWRLAQLYRRRGRILLLAMVVALVLLAEAMITVVFSRDWHLSWWEWHLLMAVAFTSVAVGARIEYRRERSLTAAFGGLYLTSTLQRLDRWHAVALADLVAARDAGPDASSRVIDRLRIDGASSDDLALLGTAADELARVDELFRPYLPAQFAERARVDPTHARLGSGEEREVSVLFADLSGFTSYSERHAPTEVVQLLNRVWSAVVPIATDAGGLIESFAGDGMLVIFNALDDHEDHPARAVRAGLAIVEAVDELFAPGGDASPRFHVGVNTGTAFVGAIGAAGRRSFSAIGDTTNLGARLLGVAEAGQVVVGPATRERLGSEFAARALEPAWLKGKRAEVQAWEVRRSP